MGQPRLIRLSYSQIIKLISIFLKVKRYQIQNHNYCFKGQNKLERMREVKLKELKHTTCFLSNRKTHHLGQIVLGAVSSSWCQKVSTASFIMSRAPPDISLGPWSHIVRCPSQLYVRSQQLYIHVFVVKLYVSPVSCGRSTLIFFNIIDRFYGSILRGLRTKSIYIYIYMAAFIVAFFK